MAIVQHRARHHIIYLGLAVLAAGCSRREEPPRSGGASRDLAAATSTKMVAPSPAPTSPASGSPAASQTAAATQAHGQTPAASQILAASQSALRSSTPASAESDESDYHIDDLDVEYEIPRRPSHPRKGRTIQIVLRSSPPGAVAAVDGVTVGPTPALWEGVVDSTPREFTFVLPGYAMARYRFVPMRGGIVHGTLEPIKPDGEDGERGRRGKGHRPGQAKNEPAPR